MTTPTEIDPGEDFTLNWKTVGTRVVLCQLIEGKDNPIVGCNDVPISGSQQVHTNHQTYNKVAYVLYAYYGDPEAHEAALTTVKVHCRYTWMLDYPPLTCPLDSALLTEGAVQYFEHGMMIWLRGSRTIYVLFKDGSNPGFYSIADPWYAGLPESDPAISPPLGAYQPTRGFGKVWRGETSIGDLRARLGWAVAPESFYSAIFQCDTAGEEVCYLTGPDWIAALNWSKGIWSVWLGPPN